MSGLLHIYCGDGKGKTTAALGLSIRAAGSGMKVLFLQFLKGNDSSEVKILNTIANITYLPCEKTFGFTWNMTEEEKKEVVQVCSDHLMLAINKATNEHYDLVVFDEIISAYQNNFINQDFFVDFLEHKPKTLEVVLTGRDPDQRLLQLADYVSCIEKVKHPFDQGIPSRVGIEE